MSDYIAYSKVTGRVQISVPKTVQTRLGGLDTKDFILFYEENNRIYIQKAALKPKNNR